VIGGRYAITKRDTITVLIPVLHRDTSVWGDDVEEFRPERFESESFAKMPPNCVEAVRQRPARVHRQAVRDAGGGAADRDDPAAVRSDRERSVLPAPGRRDADA
jgi:cytochrome P450